MSHLQNKFVEFTDCSMTSPVMASRPELRLALSDLRPIVARIDIYENLFAPTLTGEVVFQDDANLTSLLPFIGLEQLQIRFSVFNARTNSLDEYGGSKSPLLFNAYRQEGRVPQTMGAERYTLKLASVELATSIQLRVSKYYDNVKVDDIIRDILKHSLGTQKALFAESTTTPTTATIPFLTPLDTIKLMTLQGQNDSATNYLFFETLQGFHFKSIAKIIHDSNAAKTNDGYPRIPTVMQHLSGTADQPRDNLVIIADVLDIVSGYDYLYQSRQGYFASTTYAVDILSGSYEHRVSRISDPEFTSRMLVNGQGAYPVYPSGFGDLASPDAKMFVVPTMHISAANTAIAQRDPAIRDNFIAKTLDARNRELTALQSRTIRGVAAGAPGLNVGTLVNVVFPNPANAGRVVVDRDIADGKYMIVAAKHSLVNNGTGEFFYETTFEACSDSLLSSK